MKENSAEGALKAILSDDGISQSYLGWHVDISGAFDDRLSGIDFDYQKGFFGYRVRKSHVDLCDDYLDFKKGLYLLVATIRPPVIYADIDIPSRLSISYLGRKKSHPLRHC